MFSQATNIGCWSLPGQLMENVWPQRVRLDRFIYGILRLGSRWGFVHQFRYLKPRIKKMFVDVSLSYVPPLWMASSDGPSTDRPQTMDYLAVLGATPPCCRGEVHTTGLCRQRWRCEDLEHQLRLLWESESGQGRWWGETKEMPFRLCIWGLESILLDIFTKCRRWHWYIHHRKTWRLNTWDSDLLIDRLVSIMYFSVLQIVIIISKWGLIRYVTVLTPQILCPS